MLDERSRLSRRPPRTLSLAQPSAELVLETERLLDDTRRPKIVATTSEKGVRRCLRLGEPPPSAVGSGTVCIPRRAGTFPMPPWR